MPKTIGYRQRNVTACVILILTVFWSASLLAQDIDTLKLQIADVSGYVSSLVEIPVGIEIPPTDSLDGFLISLVLSRNDLVYFEVDTIIQGSDTMYVCQFDTSGALSSGWEHVQARSIAGQGLDLRLSGISDVGTGLTPGIPSATSGTLLRIFGRIKQDVPDTLTDRSVNLLIHRGTTNFSNEDGELIDPVEVTDGSVTVEQGAPGDVNCDGQINPSDVVYLVNYVYKNWHILCNTALGDLNCSSTTNPIDVVLLVNYVYKNWAIPPC